MGSEPLRPAAARGVHALAALLSVAALALWAQNAWTERFLGDDAFISFRYADHLARGMGLVWNAGERVEGYTNFLWVLLMAGSLRLGLAPEITAQLLGAASAVALLGLAFLSGGSGATGRLKGALVALALGVHGSFGAWSTGGLETMFFALLVWAATWRFLAERRGGTDAGFSSALLFALATLTRPDGGLFAAVTGLWLLAETVRGRARPRRLLVFGLAYAAVVGAHVLWRYSYYGDWLPNTFRAKVPGLRLDQGLDFLALYERHYHGLAFLPVAVLAFLGRRKAEAGLLFAQLAAQLAYVAAVGGDRFEFRFLIVVLPHYAWLVVEGAFALTERAAAAALGRKRLLGAMAVAVLAGFLGVTARGFPPRPGERYGVALVQGVRNYADRRVREGRFLRDFIQRGLLPRDLVLCVGGAGAVPYYTRWTTVDRRGLNDRWIASQTSTQRRLVAHERDVPIEYLERRRVAVFDFMNQLLVTPEGMEKHKGFHMHDGRFLTLRAIRLDELWFVFATFVSDAELAALLPGHELVTPEDLARPR